MTKEEKKAILLAYADNYRFVSDHEVNKAIGYINCQDESVIAGCAAAITILKILKEGI